MDAKLDINSVNRSLTELQAQLAQAGTHADAQMREQLDALLAQARTSQAQFTAEYRKTLDSLHQTLDEATKRAASAKESAAAAAAAAAAAPPALPSFDITPPPPPPSKIDAKFGLQLRKELLQRFGKPLPDKKSDPDHEIWEDWDEGTGDWK